MKRGPPELRFVLAIRHDLRLGLHRLRLQGELTEIRAPDLRFTAEEARELFQAAGVELTGPALAMLHERTEGWAAGLRLAALSLAGHLSYRQETMGIEAHTWPGESASHHPGDSRPGRPGPRHGPC